MYDPLTTEYTFACPARGETRVRLSAFRRLQRLPGAAHPAVFHVNFECSCGDEHVGLVSHAELDWEPLGHGGGSFVNLMTSRLDDAGADLAELTAARIGAGEWPWSFFCYPEGLPRPVTPSAFLLLAPGSPARSVGLAVRCPACSRLSVNLVSAAHVDLPFHNDAQIGVLEQVFAPDAAQALDEFRAELYSASFDARRLQL